MRVLDVATGAGDIPLALWRKSQRTGLKLEIRGIDISERALDFARQKAEASGAKIEFSCVDALEEELPAGYDAMDVVTVTDANGWHGRRIQETEDRRQKSAEPTFTNYQNNKTQNTKQQNTKPYKFTLFPLSALL